MSAQGSLRPLDAYAYAGADPVRRALRRFAASRPGSWLFIRVLHRVDRPVLRLTRGRSSFSSVVSGLPVVTLTTLGARSGRPRSVPLLGVPTDEGLALVASNFGQRHHPAWRHNLRAQPHAWVTVSGATRAVRAVEAEGERRERIWRQCVAVYPGYGAYARRAGERRIVVFVLEPA